MLTKQIGRLAKLARVFFVQITTPDHAHETEAAIAPSV